MHLQSPPFAQLHQETMTALRVEHPDWAEDVFAVYEARLSTLIRQFLKRPSHRHPKSTTHRL